MNVAGSRDRFSKFRLRFQPVAVGDEMFREAGLSSQDQTLVIPRTATGRQSIRLHSAEGAADHWATCELLKRRAVVFMAPGTFSLLGQRVGPELNEARGEPAPVMAVGGHAACTDLASVDGWGFNRSEHEMEGRRLWSGYGGRVSYSERLLICLPLLPVSFGGRAVSWAQLAPGVSTTWKTMRHPTRLCRGAPDTNLRSDFRAKIGRFQRAHDWLIHAVRLGERTPMLHCLSGFQIAMCNNPHWRRLVG